MFRLFSLSEKDKQSLASLIKNHIEELDVSSPHRVSMTVDQARKRSLIKMAQAHSMARVGNLS